MTTTDKVTKENFDARYKALVKLINGIGSEAHARVAAHIRAISNGKFASLGIYHVAATIPMEAKYEEYARLAAALGMTKDEAGKPKIAGPDWSKLQGQMGNGAKQAQPEEQPKPRERNPKTGRFDKAEPVEPKPVNDIEDETQTEPTPPPRMTMTIPRQTTEKDDLAELLAQAIQSRLKLPEQPAAQLDESRVRLVVNEELTKLDLHEAIKEANLNGAFPTERVEKLIADKLVNHAVRVELIKPDGSMKELEGRQHYKFPLLLAALSMRLNVALVGPAGSVKTTSASHAAKALELPFEAISVGPMTSKADLLGFIDAGGKYHDTATVRRAEQGGVMLWDEFDAANASVATYGNMLLANEQFGTPTGMKTKHKDFCLIAGLNTYGMGANRVYVGRNQLDGATLDRFVVIDWDYDEGLEGAIVGVNRPSPKLTMDEGGIMEAADWLEYVVKVRQACEKLSIRHVVSPRASIHGCKLFAAGVGRAHVERMVLWKGLDQATVSKITTNL